MNVFDLHCDTTKLCWEQQWDLINPTSQVSLDRPPKGKWAQVFATFVPDSYRGPSAGRFLQENYGYYQEQLKKNSSLVAPVARGGDIQAINASGRCAAILAVEGGCVLQGKMEKVQTLVDMGVKILTLTWNAPNEIGSGHDREDLGLTDFGRSLIPVLEQNHILVDISHLNDRGFDEVAERASRPFIASHSNLRSICSAPRNLTEEQFCKLARSGGVAGINLHAPFLTDEPAKAGMDHVLRHVTRFLELGGEDHVAIGSDFDGANIPPCLVGTQGLENLAEYLLVHGISEDVINKMYYDNALRLFQQLDADPLGRPTA